MAAPYAYRNGMSEFFLRQLAKRLEDISPSEDVGIGLAYVNYGGQREQFLRDFFPFAATTPIDPFYPETWERKSRRAERAKAIKSVIEAIDKLRGKMRMMRDVLSGQNFSPLTLPVRNFESEVLRSQIGATFDALRAEDVSRDTILNSTATILTKHPLRKSEDHKPFFEDDRGLRFRSPGSANHGVVRVVGIGHTASCLINGRVRLGGPLRAGFHYDCDHERGGLKATYPNCHDVQQASANGAYVNISPNDAIR